MSKFELEFMTWMNKNESVVDHARQQVSRSAEVFTATKEYRTALQEGTVTPKIVDRYFQNFWRTKAEQIKLGHDLEVPFCDRSTEELATLQKEGRGIILMPGELMQRDGMLMLDKMFPDMKLKKFSNPAVFRNDLRQGGCIDIEMNPGSPNRHTTKEEARRLFASQGRDGMTLPTYIAGSQVSKELTGHHFDEHTWSRLLGSRWFRRDVTYVEAFVYPKTGELNIASSSGMYPRLSGLGARSEGRK